MTGLFTLSADVGNTGKDGEKLPRSSPSTWGGKFVRIIRQQRFAASYFSGITLQNYAPEKDGSHNTHHIQVR